MSGQESKFILGITGSFSSGKSTVSRMFKGRSAEIIDADKLAHELLKPKTVSFIKVVSAFGEKILGARKIIDREKLGRLVFSDRRLLARLNKILQPLIIRGIKEKIKQSQSKIIILDAPLLFEAKLEGLADKTVVVNISRKKQFLRAKNKFNLSNEQIKRRLQFQIPLREKSRLADFVIDNSGTLDQTKKQVVEIRRKLWRN